MRWAQVMIAALLMAASAPQAGADAPRLSVPIQCEPGRTCFIQHYVDVDAGPAGRDFRCGTTTYDGHTGTDFRVLSTAAANRGVAVLAAAPGIIRQWRDGMDDVFARESGIDRQSRIACGNSVAIDHGGGWVTRYCHMREGSVAVKLGDRVARGDRLGDVGWSGLADFAHVHVTVLHNGRTVDPATGAEPDGSCRRDSPSATLWDDAFARAFPYANGEIIGIGFAERAPTAIEMERDHEDVTPPTRTSEALMVYARFMNVRAGDRARFKVRGPAGFVSEIESAPLPRNQQVLVLAGGKKRAGAQFLAGRYDGSAELIRDGAVIARREATFGLP